MVYRNNNIKSKKLSNDETDMPVYPFSVDISSLPERKYLSGIYSISKLSFVFMLTAVILSFILIIKAYSVKINPYFVYWDKYETKFVHLKTREELKPKEMIRKLTENTYLTEFFIREYLTKTFSFSTMLVQNEEVWCDCMRDEKLQNSDFLNVTKKCYICNFSSQSVYANFLKNQKATFDLMIQQGSNQTITILNMEPIRMLEIGRKKSFLSGFLPEREVQVQSEYKVDFIVETMNSNKIINQEVLTAFIIVSGLKSYPRNKKVVSVSYMFNPNYELILANYRKQKEDMKIENNL